MTPEQKKALSEKLKAKWASGTRKPTPKWAYEKSSATQKAGYAEGRLKPHDRVWTPETAKQAAQKRDPKKVAANCSTVGKENFGKPKPPGPSAKGPENQFAKYYELYGPNGEVLKGMNLSELVRQNEHLFDKSDLNWDRAWKCRATKGLRALFQTKRAPKSWKGWTAGSMSDEAPNTERSGAERPTGAPS